MSFEFLNLFINIALQNANSDAQQVLTIAKYKYGAYEPCDNFYDHICVRWREHHDEKGYNEITELNDYAINKEMLKLIEKYQNESNNIISKMRTYLKACKAQKVRRFSSYLNIVKPADGLNWPILHELSSNETWQNEKFHWMPTVANLRQFGLNKVLMDQLVLHSYNDAKTFVIDIDRPDSDTRHRLPEQSKLMKIMQTIGFPLSKAFKFNNQLRDLEWKLFALQNASNSDEVNLLTLTELRAELPQLPWNQYFQILTKQNASDNFKIQLRNKSYFESLDKLLSETAPELICTYFMIHFMYFAMYEGRSSGNDIDCLIDMRNKMSLAFDFIYYENFYKQNEEIYRHDVTTIFESLRYEYSKRFRANKMNLNKAELDYFLNKLNAMKLKIGTLPANATEKFVEEFYADIEPDAENYIQNQLDLLRLKFQKEHERLTQPLQDVDDFFIISDEEVSARNSGPVYLAHLNWVNVPFGFLRKPIYDHQMHDVLKFSLLGFIIGHEISHAFDFDNIVYDALGRFELEVSGGIIANEQYDGLFQCLQQSSIETSAINERFADFAGLQLALDAFSKRVSSQDKRVFGQLTKQVFFMNFAQFFCGNMDAEFVDHDTDRVRLEWSIMNNKAFGDAYNCKKSDKMMGAAKCELW